MIFTVAGEDQYRKSYYNIISISSLANTLYFGNGCKRARHQQPGKTFDFLFELYDKFTAGLFVKGKKTKKK